MPNPYYNFNQTSFPGRIARASEINGQLELVQQGFGLVEQAIQNIQTSEIVELGGDFNVGESVKCARIGDIVVITSLDNSLGHTSGSIVSSAQGIIPAIYRPASTVTNTYLVTGSGVLATYACGITSDGRIDVFYTEDGSSVDRTSTGRPVCLSFCTD